MTRLGHAVEQAFAAAERQPSEEKATNYQRDVALPNSVLVHRLTAGDSARSGSKDRVLDRDVSLPGALGSPYAASGDSVVAGDVAPNSANLKASTLSAPASSWDPSPWPDLIPTFQPPVPQLPEPPPDRPSEQLPASLRVKIVAHASPRWRAAKDTTEADADNMELSRQRMEEIRDIVDERLQYKLGPHVKIDYDVEYVQPDEPGSVLVTHESHGSHDTLREAKGNRERNDPFFRRVDVYIDDTTATRDYSGVSTPRRTTTVVKKATHWQVKVNVTVSAAAGGAAGLVTLTLRNADTGREDFFHIVGVGSGTKGAGVAGSVSGGYTDFYTDDPAGFADFDGAGVNYSTVGVGLFFVDYEKSYLSFPSMGKGAMFISVGGWNVGALLVPGGYTISGRLAADGSFSDEYEVHSDYDETFMDSRSTRGDLYQAFFETGKYVLPPKDRTELRKFVDIATERFRKSTP
jgi:hypothetical protein